MTSAQSGLHFLSGGGEMGDRIRTFDWSNHALGDPREWPQSLKTSVSLILNSQHPMWIGWGHEMWFLYNDAYIYVLGEAKHPEALGRPASAVWAEIWDVCGPLADRVFSKGEASFVDDTRLFMNRGDFLEETWYSFSYSPIRNEAGDVGGLFCPSNDVTAKVIGARRLRTLAELSSAALVQKTTEAACASAAEALSRNPDDVPFALLYLTDRNEAMLQQAVRLDVTASEIAPARVELSSESGSVWPFSEVFRTVQPRRVSVAEFGSLPRGAAAQPVSEAMVLPVASSVDGKTIGVLIAGVSPARRLDNDYTTFFSLAATSVGTAIQNARAAEEERKRADALAEIDRAKTAFFSNVSHEFRTPLTLILGIVEEALGKSDEATFADVRDSLDVVHRNGLRLQRLVNTLLDFSRIEAGRARAHYVKTDIEAFTAELASSFRSTMERAGLQFVVESEPVGNAVYVDRDMWEKIVLNLLSNAFKFTLKGKVTVSVREHPGRVDLSVEDTGVGIPEEQLSRIFERFHRVENVRGRTHEGTGIGLALVHELVNLHGGSVAVQSSPGKGTRFTVSIPSGDAHLPKEHLRTADSAPSTAIHADMYVEEALRWLTPTAPETSSASSIATESLRGTKKGIQQRVLVADDNADMRDYVCRLLAGKYDTTPAANGREALVSALANPPDLVLTDVMMPELDGFGLLKALREHERTKTLPIIMLSARAGEESRIDGMEAGADDYLVKPFTARELTARVEAHLSLNGMRRQAEDARRLSEVRLGLALQSTRMVAWEWDVETDRITSVGELRDVFGTSVVCAADMFALLHPDDRQTHIEDVERVKRDGGAWFSEFRIQRPDNGGTSWVEERATGIADARGRIARIAGVTSDITARKAAESELLQRNAELERANSELEEFAFVASHDLQEPLRTVNVYTDFLLRYLGKQTDPHAIQFVGYIHEGVERMQLLIQDLLAYSRIVHREQEPVAPVQLKSAAELAMHSLAGSITASNASVSLKIDGAMVTGEIGQIAQVFENLLSNSLKYSRPESRPVVRMAAARSGEEWVVTVSDNGIGFEPEFSERIFGLFKRLHKNAYPGTGLGLAICKRIVERYGGTIRAKSEGPGKGTEVTFTLRAAEGRAGAPKESSAVN